MKYIYIYLLAVFIKTHAQNVLVLDSLNKKPIPLIHSTKSRLKAVISI